MKSDSPGCRGALIARAALLLLVGAGLLLTPSPSSAYWTGNVGFLLGQKFLPNDWDPLKDVRERAILVDVRQDTWPLSLAVDLLRSEGSARGDTFTVEDKTFELHLGGRKIWNNGSDEPALRPYLEAGVSLSHTEARVRTLSEPAEHSRAFGAGAWGGGGLYWSPLPHVNVGVDARWSTVPVKLFGERFDAGGVYVGVLVGWRWLAI